MVRCALSRTLTPPPRRGNVQEDDEDGSDDDEPQTLGAAAKRKAADAKAATKRGKDATVAAAAAPGRRGPKTVVESVKKDLASLTAEEQAAAVMSDAPELVALANELKETLVEARTLERSRSPACDAP